MQLGQLLSPYIRKFQYGGDASTPEGFEFLEGLEHGELQRYLENKFGVENASNTAQYVWSDNNTMRGYNAAVSNQVSSTLTKGNQSLSSAIIFGSFNDLIVGMWGGLDIAVDTSTGSASGTVRIVALQDVDVAVRHAESFAAMKDALTA